MPNEESLYPADWLRIDGKNLGASVTIKRGRI